MQLTDWRKTKCLFLLEGAGNEMVSERKRYLIFGKNGPAPNSSGVQSVVSWGEFIFVKQKKKVLYIYIL